MRIARLTAIAAVAVLSLGVAACGGDDGDDGGTGTGSGSGASGIVGKAEKDKKLVIGVKADQPGLGLQTGNGYEGFDIEIGKIIAGKLGIEPGDIEWVETVSANREAFIVNDRVDLVIATYTINDERKQQVDFAGPY